MPSDKREDRITKRREAILEAAATVFTQKGYTGATIRDIAQAAGVADGTIYNYFSNKEALLLALFDRLVDAEQTSSQLELALTDDLEELIITYFGHHLATVRANYDLFRAIIPEILATPDLRQRYYEAFVAPMLGVAERHIRRRVERGDLQAAHPDDVARLIYGLFFGLLCLRILGDPGLDPSEATDARLVGTVKRLFLEGLA